MKLRIVLITIGSLLCLNLAQADNTTALMQAINALNAKANTELGKRLVMGSVAQETGVPLKTVQSQLKSTNLSYGDLLVADSLAAGSGKNLNDILGMRAKGKGWVQISTSLGINSASLVRRAQHASQTVQYSMTQQKPQREHQRMMERDAGLNGPGNLGSGAGAHGN